MADQPFNRKAIFLWQTSQVKGGDPDSIAQLLADAGFEAVYVKAADGPYVYAPNGKANLTQALMTALKKRGIIVIGWGFNYGTDPVGEGKIAALQTQAFGLDGWIFDVESKFEAQPSPADRIQTVFNSYRAGGGSVPTAFCSWYFWQSPTTEAQWHNKAMASAAMQLADFGMPMIYWGGMSAASAIWTLKESLRQWGLITAKPIVPVGRAYTGDGGTVYAPAITAFAAEARNMHAPGLSWWLLDDAYLIPDVWAALKAIPPFGPVSAPPVDSTATLAALKTIIAAEADKLAGLAQELKDAIK